MPRLPVLVVATLLAALLAAPAWAQQAVYVIRHAERADGSFNSPLSPAGHARAARLAKMLGTSGIGAIFVSDLRRTAQTAAPLAQVLHVKPVAMTGTLELVKAVQAQPREQIVLVVGHSNTVSHILEGLGYEGAALPDTGDYDNLFVLIPTAAGRPTLLRLKY